MLKSFKCKDTSKLHDGKYVKSFDKIQDAARRKLLVLEAATSLEDLRSPPGNHLEELKADRVGQHSIKVNDQYRVCFVFKDGNAHDVEITDYH